MSDVLTLRIESLELIRMAHKHEFEGPYAIVALTAGIYEIAAAILEHNQLLDAIATDYRRCWERNRGEPKANGRKR